LFYLVFYFGELFITCSIMEELVSTHAGLTHAGFQCFFLACDDSQLFVIFSVIFITFWSSQTKFKQ